LERRYEKSRRYIYRIDLITHTKKRRKFNKRFLSLRIARLYFITLKDYQFRALFRRASKLDGDLEKNYCLLLECRIMAIFYRTNFLYNIFEIIQFIKAGHVFINFKIIKHINCPINTISYITCSKNTINRLRSNLKKRLKFKLILFNTPKFLYISYFFFFAYLCKLPQKKDFVYPFSLDIQRITGYN
jgi:small subunit ribosomal protein S4